MKGYKLYKIVWDGDGSKFNDLRFIWVDSFESALDQFNSLRPDLDIKIIEIYGYINDATALDLLKSYYRKVDADMEISCGALDAT